MKVVAFVPIKLNNQRLPGKNLLPLGGKAVCRHLFDTLARVEGVDEKYVFCSDAEICRYMPEELRFLQRDKSLDRFETKGLDLIGSFVQKVDADIYLLAHATNPFVKKESIEAALNKVLFGEYDSAFSAERLQGYCWYRGQPVNFDAADFQRTQDIDKVYLETGGFFIFRKEVFTKYHRRIGLNPYIHAVDMYESADIDEADDYEFCKLICSYLESGK